MNFKASPLWLRGSRNTCYSLMRLQRLHPVYSDMHEQATIPPHWMIYIIHATRVGCRREDGFQFTERQQCSNEATTGPFHSAGHSTIRLCSHLRSTNQIFFLIYRTGKREDFETMNSSFQHLFFALNALLKVRQFPSSIFSKRFLLEYV